MAHEKSFGATCDLPFFGLWVDRFKATTESWTDQEVGAYLRLLMHQWVHYEVPSNPRRRARICDSLDDSWSLLEAKFPAGPDGRLINRRLEGERDRVSTAHFKASEKGRKAAAARWAGRRKAQDETAQAMPEHEPTYEPEHEHEQSQRNSNQNQNQIEEPEPDPTPRAGARDGGLDPDAVLEALWDHYPIEHRGNHAKAARSIFAAWPSIEGLTLETMLANLEAWKVCRKWTKDGGQFTQTLHSWIEAGNYAVAPGRPSAPETQPRSTELERAENFRSLAKMTLENTNTYEGDEGELLRELGLLSTAREIAQRFKSATGMTVTGDPA